MGLVLAAAMILAAFVLLRSEWEKLQLRPVRYRIPTEKTVRNSGGQPAENRKLRLLFISDLHDYVPARHRPEEILQRIDDEQPDAILVGGDMITASKYRKRPQPDTAAALNLLRQLAEKYPVYYGEGNHESRLRERNAEAYASYVTELLKMGVRYLADTSCSLMLGDGTESGISVTGISLEPEYYLSKPGFGLSQQLPEGYLRKKLAGTDPSAFRILLLHSPAFLKDAAAQGIDLVLSGHFHGGTVRLPGGAGLMTPQCRFFVKECSGRFHEKDTDMIVTRGLGTHSIRVRLNDLPELTVIDLI